jgi:CheY-like chemotaxis protein
MRGIERKDERAASGKLHCKPRRVGVRNGSAFIQDGNVGTWFAFNSSSIFIDEGDMQIGVETSRAVENKRIFVIDEDEIFRAALQFMLHDENETHEAASLDWTFEKAREWKPDLVLLAESVIRKNGVAVIGEIAARIPGVKILVVLDSAGGGLGKEALGAGAHGLIVKPLTVELVRQKVDVLLGRRRSMEIPLKVLNTR